jgi:hypothetical protein
MGTVSRDSVALKDWAAHGDPPPTAASARLIATAAGKLDEFFRRELPAWTAADGWRTAGDSC